MYSCLGCHSNLSLGDVFLPRMPQQPITRRCIRASDATAISHSEMYSCLGCHSKPLTRRCIRASDATATSHSSPHSSYIWHALDQSSVLVGRPGLIHVNLRSKNFRLFRMTGKFPRTANVTQDLRFSRRWLWRISCHPDDGGARFLRNVGSYKSHTA
jgi:hypothetical protein